MEVSEAGHQSLSNREEFDEAIEILLEDEDLGPAIREQRIVPYPPMPSLIEAELPDGRLERTLAVGLLPRERRSAPRNRRREHDPSNGGAIPR
jgi:hypothetical protein